MPGWASPARPAVYKPPVGARVAAPQSPILRWSTPRVSALDWATSGLSKSPLLIARPLLLTTNCPLLLTTAVRFCSHRDTLGVWVRWRIWKVPRLDRSTAPVSFPAPQLPPTTLPPVPSFAATVPTRASTALPPCCSRGATVVLPCGSRNPLILPHLRRRRFACCLPCIRPDPTVLPRCSCGATTARLPCGSRNSLNTLRLCTPASPGCLSFPEIRMQEAPFRPSPLFLRCLALNHSLSQQPPYLPPKPAPRANLTNEELLTGQRTLLGPTLAAPALRPRGAEALPLFLRESLARTPRLRSGAENRPRALLLRRARVLGTDVSAPAQTALAH